MSASIEQRNDYPTVAYGDSSPDKGSQGVRGAGPKPNPEGRRVSARGHSAIPQLVCTSIGRRQARGFLGPQP